MTFFPIHFRFILKRLVISWFLIYLLSFTAYLFLETTQKILTSTDFNLIDWLTQTLIKKFEIYCPISSIIATIYTISSLKHHNEIIALRACGISKHSLAAPFYFFAITLSLITYINSVYFFPIVKSLVHESKPNYPFEVNQLEDGSTIIYQTKDHKSYDLFWIKSHSEFIHCKSVKEDNQKLYGKDVDFFIRNKEHQIEKVGSTELIPLPHFLFEKKEIAQKKSLSLLTLFKKDLLSYDSRPLFTLACYQIASSTLPLISIIAFLPLLFYFSRQDYSYLSYFLGILSFLLISSILKTFVVLAENYIISPIFTLLLLPVILLTTLFIRFCKTA